MSNRWHLDASNQRLTFPAFTLSDYDDLSRVNVLNQHLYLVDINFEALEYQKQLLDQKAIVLQKELPAQDLFPTSVFPISHTAIFYVGLELVRGIQDQGSVLGMRII